MLNNAPQPIATKPKDPAQALLQHRLQMTNQHVRNAATVLDHYADECRRAGLVAAARAIQTAAGDLYVVARLNDRALSSMEIPTCPTNRS